MQPTPPLPGWIRDFRTPAYTNIYELCPHETRLYGTESLYGDWSAPVLLLAKDFAPRSFIQERIAQGDDRPFRHEPALKTNRMLTRYAQPLGKQVLYGSAMAGLLKNEGGFRSNLPDRAAVMPHAARVLRFTIEHMTHLCVIACLGADAWQCTMMALGIQGAGWREHRLARAVVNVDGVAVAALPHPSTCPGGSEAVRADWAALIARVQACRAAAA